ncbi:putative endoglucanase [Phaeosphaeria sp. MPI-PUGE-AT-0046c]|nr:putative endoglucanase [Phaeosphaeria sp. MPI-PUGE-AT-0046c]
MMYSAATVALLASMMPMASAHYFFDKLVINGQGSTDFVRQNTRPIAYMPTKFIKSFDNITPESTDFRCNMGATNKGSKATANVKAGDSLAMSLGVGASFQHPGPAQVYMSKAPGSVGSYDGSGDWFKIHQETVCKQGADIKKEAWCTWDKDRISFKIPQGIPDGEYLIRSEHIGLHGAHGGEAEFYYGCAQVKVTGGGNAVPTNTVKIPGVYKKSDPEVNFSVWGGNNVKYPTKGPGPEVFTGGASSSAPVTEKAPASGNEQPSKIPSGTAPSGTAPSGTAPSGTAPSATAPSGTTPSAPAQQNPAPSADPTKCGMYARRHARDMAN